MAGNRTEARRKVNKSRIQRNLVELDRSRVRKWYIRTHIYIIQLLWQKIFIVMHEKKVWSIASVNDPSKEEERKNRC